MKRLSEMDLTHLNHVFHFFLNNERNYWNAADSLKIYQLSTILNHVFRGKVSNSSHVAKHE